MRRRNIEESEYLKRKTEFQRMNNAHFKPTIGDRLDRRYEVLKLLGTGHFSSVWLAYDHKSSTTVALKIIKGSRNHSFFAEHELRILHTIRANSIMSGTSSRVIRMLDTFTQHHTSFNHICVVFEWMDSSLRQLLRGPERLPLKSVKSIFYQIIQGLRFLHDTCSIVHADLKPENILVTSLLQIKLADFGTSFEIGREVFYNIQTRPYRAPEVIIRRTLTSSVDIWSAGCICYELASGEQLFGCIKSKNTLQKNKEHLVLIIQTLGECPRWLASSTTLPSSVPKGPGIQELLMGNGIGPKEASDMAKYISSILRIEYFARPSASHCLEHEWLGRNCLLDNYKY